MSDLHPPSSIFHPPPSEPRYHRGLWRLLARLLKVSTDPPRLPGDPGGAPLVLKPADGWLNLKRVRWAVVTVLLGAVGLSVSLWFDWADGFFNWIETPAYRSWAAWAFRAFEVASFALAIPAVFVALHLEYDATWYVLGERSMRLRRGLWTVRETTLTYANVQNVSVKQGPLQRLFGVSDLLVETAGGGAAKQPGEGAEGHRGLLAGLGDAAAVRDRITARVSAARDAGLGDEVPERAAPRAAGGFTAAHVAALREIRDLVADGGN